MNRLLAVFFPRRCIFCGRVVHYNEMACRDCAAKLGAQSCRGAVERKGVRCAAPYHYAGFVREQMLLLKKQEHRELADWFAPRMADSVRDAFAGQSFELVVCVPNEEPEGERRYNHARVLARRVARELALPFCDAMRQTRPKHSQHLLDAAARAENVRGLFAPKGEQEARQLRGAAVLLVDDIVTTGSTLASCAQALADAGTRLVCGLAAARTEFEATEDKNGNSC